MRARKRGEEMYDEFIEWYYNEYIKDENISQDNETAADTEE